MPIYRPSIIRSPNRLMETPAAVAYAYDATYLSQGTNSPAPSFRPTAGRYVPVDELGRNAIQRHCAICAEPLLEPARATAGLCLICAHRTTLA